MSWDVAFFAAKEPPPPAAEMPNDWQGEVLGSATEVRRKISLCLPEVDWNDPAWGRYDGGTYVLQFNLGSRDPCSSFLVHGFGSGDAVAPLLQIASRWGWYLFEVSQGEWFHHCPDADAGWRSFQAYRDRVIGPPGD